MTTSNETEVVPARERATDVEARRNIPVLILLGVMCVLFVLAAFIGIDGAHRGSSVVSERTSAPPVPPARPPSTNGAHS
jgi:hypothetical protein